jgi:hypothetical protein
MTAADDGAAKKETAPMHRPDSTQVEGVATAGASTAAAAAVPAGPTPSANDQLVD